MVVRRKKKKKKQRGKRWHGHGHKKKARGAGSRGGRGNAGGFKHKKLKMMKEQPDRLGKRGFSRAAVQEEVETINLIELDQMVEDGQEVDLSSLGYDKLLGKGKVTKSMTVKGEVSDNAKKKIEEAGGTVVPE